MKLATENPPAYSPCETFQIEVPFGLIGLTHLRRFEISPVLGGEPFVRLASLGDEEIEFLAIEPRDIIPGYEIELSDEDCEALRITNSEDAIVFNIVTVHSSGPQYVTVNLVGPLVVNRATLIGKQVVIENRTRYSTKYALADERELALAS
jgi:flagellar assembly factor FliW